jgi:hypothetical protein
MSAIAPAMALFLALVLTAAAAHKLLDSERLGAAAARLTGAPAALGTPISYAAAAVEGVAALALAVPATRSIGLALAALLWTGYGAALLAARARGETTLDCGCSFGAQRHGGDGIAPKRAFALAVLATATLLVPHAGAIAIETVFAGLAMFTLYLTAGELAALPATSREMVR